MPSSPLHVERTLDGTVARWASAQRARWSFSIWLLALAACFAVFPVWAVWSMFSGPSLHLSLLRIGGLVAVAAMSPALLAPIRKGVGRYFAYQLTFRGQTLQLLGPFGTERLPLSEVTAVDTALRAIVTSDFRYIPLAPLAPGEVRDELVRFLQEHLSHRAGGTEADVPDAVRALQQKQPSGADA